MQSIHANRCTSVRSKLPLTPRPGWPQARPTRHGCRAVSTGGDVWRLEATGTATVQLGGSRHLCLPSLALHSCVYVGGSISSPAQPAVAAYDTIQKCKPCRAPAFREPKPLGKPKHSLPVRQPFLTFPHCGWLGSPSKTSVWSLDLEGGSQGLGSPGMEAFQ